MDSMRQIMVKFSSCINTTEKQKFLHATSGIQNIIKM